MKKSKACGAGMVFSLILLMGLAMGSCSGGDDQPAGTPGDASKGAAEAEAGGAETAQSSAESALEESAEESPAPPPPPPPPPSPPPPPKEPIVIEGTINDEKGLMVRELMPEGYSWTGKFDMVAQKAISITAETRRGERIIVNPDEDGGFRIEALERVERLELRVTGGGLYVEKNGPWRESSLVDFEVEEEGLFLIEGRVKFGDLSSAARVMVSGYDANDKRMVMGYADSEGRFRLRSSREVAYLRATVGGMLLREEGPWSSDTVVDLGYEADELTTLMFNVQTTSGQALADVSISASDEERRSLGTSMSDAKGMSMLTTDKTVGSITARRQNGQVVVVEGPWDADATITIEFPVPLLFTLQGKVTGKDGRGLAKVDVVPLDEAGAAMPGGLTDRVGNYSIECVKKVGSITATLNTEGTVEGPWDSDATVDIALDE